MSEIRVGDIRIWRDDDGKPVLIYEVISEPYESIPNKPLGVDISIIQDFNDWYGDVMFMYIRYVMAHDLYVDLNKELDNV